MPQRVHFDEDAGDFRMTHIVELGAALREWYIGNNARLVQMARLNRDDYTNLPNQGYVVRQSKVIR